MCTLICTVNLNNATEILKRNFGIDNNVFKNIVTMCFSVCLCTRFWSKGVLGSLTLWVVSDGKLNVIDTF